MAKKPVQIGVIGCGHWGPNHIRVFSQLDGASVVMCADPDGARLTAVQKTYPKIRAVKDYRAILKNTEVQAVCVAVPTGLHYRVAMESLEAGKDVLCEKPLALTTRQCQDLGDMARRRKKILMVGHVFLFNAGIVWLKNYIRSGKLGRVYYAYATRTNLGPFRYDVNALWDLASHDVSIFNFLFDGCPADVSGRGQKCLGKTLEDLAFATLSYPGRILANIHVSWLDPRKVRQITIVGDKKMVVWDDLDGAGPIKLYDKHVEKTKVFYETYGEFQLLSKEGSITIPKINASEPLKLQGRYFLSCVSRRKLPRIADTDKGRDVVRTLTALQKSMDRGGISVKVPRS